MLVHGTQEGEAVAVRPTAGPAAPAPKVPVSQLPAQELTPQILYQFLLAEIAGSRGNVRLAVDAYRDLAQVTGDPRIMQRALEVVINTLEVALRARRYDVALGAARIWAELDPKSTRARQMVTSLLAAGARPEELADHVARQLAAEGGNLPNALLQLNRALSRLPDKRQVLAIVEQVTTPYLGIAEAHFARAVAAHGAQDATRALGEAERAVALRPEWEQAVLLRSQLQPRPEAIEGLSRFVAEHPASRELRQALARMLVAEKRYAEARREFAALLAGAPDDVETLYALGVLAYQQQDTHEAERHFQRLLELDFADADSVRLYLGQIAEEGKHWDDALKWYGAIGPGDQFAAARLRQALVLSKQDKLDAALRHLQEARAAHHEHEVRLLIGEAQLLREAGRTADALAVLDAGLAAQPDQQELLYESALVAERLGRIDIFEARLKRLLQLKPDHAHALNAMGYSLAERNVRLDEAQAADRPGAGTRTRRSLHPRFQGLGAVPSRRGGGGPGHAAARLRHSPRSRNCGPSRRGAVVPRPSRRGDQNMGRGGQDPSRQRRPDGHHQALPALSLLARLLPFCLALLSACAALPPPAPSAAVEGFSLTGRLSLRQGEMSHHVGISWRHEAGRDEIFLSGPLGQGLAELTRDANGARLLTAERKVITAPDWDSLAERAFGARLPLSNLPRWLATVPPAPTFHVDGWRIDILDVADGRPVLIELHRDDIEARLKIDSWTE